MYLLRLPENTKNSCRKLDLGNMQPLWEYLSSEQLVFPRGLGNVFFWTNLPAK